MGVRWVWWSVVSAVLALGGVTPFLLSSQPGDSVFLVVGGSYVAVILLGLIGVAVHASRSRAESLWVAAGRSGVVAAAVAIPAALVFAAAAGVALARSATAAATDGVEAIDGLGRELGLELALAALGGMVAFAAVGWVLVTLVAWSIARLLPEPAANRPGA